MTDQEVYQTFVNLDRDSLVNIANSATYEIMNYLVSYYGISEVDATTILIIAFSNFACADGEISYDEYLLFREVMGPNLQITYSKFKNVAEGSSDGEMAAKFYDIMKSEGKDSILKKNVITLGLAVSAIDGKITFDEQMLIENLAS